jgi:threonine dehydrogenase-like Zn-dependent dehydrogenase
MTAVQESGRVHVVGAGPVGLLLTALLQPTQGLSYSSL